MHRVSGRREPPTAKHPHNELLRRLEQDIVDSTFYVDGEELALPVKLRVHESIFVPMAKWSKL